jgi:hypothetical protein
MTAKIPTAQAISALLKRAGFTRSTSTGGHGSTTGFIVSEGPQPGMIRVRYHSRTEGASSAPEYIEAKAGQYVEVIRKAGYAAERGDHPAELTVSRACGATAYQPGFSDKMAACWLPETPHVWHENQFGRFDWDERNEPRED